MMALVPCREGVLYQSQAFQFDVWFKEPRLLSFAVAIFPAGFVATPSPGFLEWHAESQTLTATEGTDECNKDIRVFRYTYQFKPALNIAEWAPTLVKVELGKHDCTDADWRTYWEASPWRPVQ